MGLLTDTKQRQAIAGLIVHHHQKLSTLLYIAGLVWFLALAYRPLSAGTYFSENALLPGLVESNLPPGFPALFTFADALKVEMNRDKKVVPKEWIFKQFQSLGLDTYRHNFTIKYPFKMAISQDLIGENVYAILRARRTASLEALVMTAPLRSASNKKTHTDGGVALMLALAQHFRRNPYWAKDVIFLLTEFEEVGVQAWLHAYHETKSLYVVPDHLPGRSGAIQAAINLELPNDVVRYLNLKVEGLNGQLPNLDLVNLAVRLSRREQVPATLHHRRNPVEQESWEGYQHMLTTMLKMMWSQASGAPSGNHGLFHRFSIEALTLEGVQKKKGTRKYDLDQVARVVEGVFRSLNNLLERFHQSFFFYLLPSTDRYVSIGLYMPPFGLMVVAGVIKALALWIALHTAENTDEEKKDSTDTKAKEEEKTENKNLDDNKEKQKEAKGEEDAGLYPVKKTGGDSPGLKRRLAADRGEGARDSEEREEGVRDLAEDLLGEDFDLDDLDAESSDNTGLMSVAPLVLMAYLLGLMAYTTPSILTRFTPAWKLKPADTILFGILAVFTAGLAYPYLMNRKTDPSEKVGGDGRLVQCVALILQGLTLLAVSLINISLAFFLAAVSVPVTMAVHPTGNSLLRLLQQFALLVVSPMGALLAASVINVALQSPGDGVLLWLWNSVEEMKQLMFLVLVDQYLFSSWTYTLAAFAFLPTWLLFWAVPFCHQDSAGKESVGKDSAWKDSVGKETAGKDSLGKDGIQKDSTGKDSISKDNAASSMRDLED